MYFTKRQSSVTKRLRCGRVFQQYVCNKVIISVSVKEFCENRSIFAATQSIKLQLPVAACMNRRVIVIGYTGAGGPQRITRGQWFTARKHCRLRKQCRSYIVGTYVRPSVRPSVTRWLVLFQNDGSCYDQEILIDSPRTRKGLHSTRTLNERGRKGAIFGL